MGIPEEDLDHIFDVFFRSKKAEQEQIQGTGIGLALVREVLELLNGRIQVDSKLNEGTIFTVWLPFHAPAKTHSTHPQFAPSGPLAPGEPAAIESENNLLSPRQVQVLIIEDHQEMQQYLRDLLSEQYRLLSAANGEEGIKLAMEHLPDLIICDMMMPGKSGLEVCQFLKKEDTTKHIPLIMLTAKSDLATVKESIRHGADLYLTKPFEEEQLLLWMNNRLQQRRTLERALSTSERIARSMVNTHHLSDNDQQLLESFVTLIRQNIGNPELDIPWLATRLNRSVSKFQREFKGLSGQSVKTYIRKLRMQLAKELLLGSNLTIEQVSQEVGYASLASFSRAFKRYEKVSPKAFREREA